MGFASLRFSVADGIGRITLARPERGNPFDDVFARELRQVAETCSARDEVRAVLIDAEGPHFSFGGDLKLLARSRDDLSPFVARLLPDLIAGIAALARADAPVVCAVQGVVAGGGVGLVSSADIVLAGPEARFAAAFSAIGLCADFGRKLFPAPPRRIGASHRVLSPQRDLVG